MLCLVNISDELHLKIIQELLEHDQLLYEKSLLKEGEHGYKDQDDELQYHRNLMNWSCTSLYFRNLHAPYIFTSIKLRNDEKSGASVDALRKSRHGDLVKEIYFLGTIPHGTANPDDNVEDDDALAEGFMKPKKKIACQSLSHSPQSSTTFYRTCTNFPISSP